MKTLEFIFNDLNKKEWGKGPWLKEPDKMQWQDKETGLPCLIVRNYVGALCGYVGVSKGHRFYKTDYENVPTIQCHGGLSFSNFCRDKVCHIVDAGEDDKVWWLGFDCGHWQDLIPGFSKDLNSSKIVSAVYRTMPYVKKECKNLAKQLAGTR